MKKYKSSVILCGGKGSRLGDLGKKIPKTLIKVQGKPILWYILKTLKKADFNHIILALGYKKEKIVQYVNKNTKSFSNMQIDCIDTGNNSSIANRIFKIKNKIKSFNFILLNSDSIFNFNIKKYFRLHEDNKLDLSLLSTNIRADFGSIVIKKNKVVDFRRNAKFDKIIFDDKLKIGVVYSGIAILNKKVLNLDFKNYKNFEMQFYPKIIKKLNCKYFSPGGFWKGMDNVKEINSLNSKKNKVVYNLIKKIKFQLKKN